jgi:hypothetical protein
VPSVTDLLRLPFFADVKVKQKHPERQVRIDVSFPFMVIIVRGLIGVFFSLAMRAKKLKF